MSRIWLPIGDYVFRRVGGAVSDQRLVIMCLEEWVEQYPIDIMCLGEWVEQYLIGDYVFRSVGGAVSDW